MRTRATCLLCSWWRFGHEAAHLAHLHKRLNPSHPVRIEVVR